MHHAVHTAAVLARPGTECTFASPEVIWEVLSEVALQQLTVHVDTPDSCPSTMGLRCISGTRSGLLLERKSLPPADEAHGHFRLFGVLYRFEGSLRSSGDALELVVQQMRCLEERRAFRLALPQGEVQAFWSAPDAGWLVTADVTELTPDGFRVTSSSVPPTESFGIGLQIGSTKVFGIAQRRSLAVDDEGRADAGLKFSSELNRSALVDAYLARRFPNLHPRRSLRPEAVRALFDRSGYLALRDGTGPASPWYQIDADGLSRDVIYVGADGELVGHVSVTRAYSKAWIGHQIATLKDHPEAYEARFSLYQYFAAIPTLFDGEDAMLLGYYNRSKRWHQLFFDGFVSWANDPSLAVVVPFDRFERVAGATVPARVSPAPGIEVGPLLDHERVLAAVIARRGMPDLAARALDLTPERIITSQLHPAFSRSRYERGRSALALRIRGELRAVALCETGSRALSLFNVVNIAQIFGARRSEGLPVEAQRALLDAVRQFYRARDIDAPLITAAPGVIEPNAEAGTELAETMGCIVWSGPGLRHYENFVRFHFGHHRFGGRRSDQHAA